MDLNDLRRALRRFWIPSAAVFCLTVVAGYVAATSGGPSFVSTSTIAVTPNPAESGGIERVNFEIPVIVETVGSRSFRVQLAQVLDASHLVAVSSLTATSEPGTGIVRITAEGSDRSAVAEVVNAAAAAVIADYPASDADPLTPPTTGDLMVVDVIDEATEDGGSGRDNVLPILLASIVLGAIIAGAVAALAQKSSRAFDVATRIRTEIGVPVLAVVPAARELNADDVDLRELLTSGPPGLVEAFQTLRTRTEVLLRDVEPMVAVTSWQRGEGRTTITAGLGLLLAAIGQETVVIDADLRAPELDDRLGEPFGKGLSELADLDTTDVVRETGHPNLGLVSAGVAEIHPAEILATALPDALDVIWKQSPHAVVVIDAPPLGPVQRNGRRVQRAAEIWTVLRTADAVLLVVDASTAHLPELAVSVERLQEDGVTVIGAVVNRRRRGLWSRR
jgi:Mrp family chromosome partitioning ATPase